MFPIRTYFFPVGNGPDSHGASSTFTRGNWAIQVNAIVLDSFEAEPSMVLADFLARCHYAE